MNDKKLMRRKIIEEGMPRPITTDAPTPEEIKNSEGLVNFLKKKELYETIEELQNREDVLENLSRLLNEFVTGIAKAKNKPEYILENARGKLFSFGSYRLGVQAPGADIDLLCATPNYVKREDFFNIFTFLLKSDKGTEEINPVEGAYVPCIKIKYEGVECDLLFAALPFEIIETDLSVLDENILNNADEAVIRSLNGCRTTDMILELVTDPAEYKVALKFIKKWAEERGVYSNKMGYFGGVNLAILMCYIYELYPNACSFILLKKFFYVYQQYKYEKPIQLRTHKKNNTDMDKYVWDPTVNRRDQGHKMILLTPAYPGQNSTPSVNEYSLKVLVDEFARGYNIIKEIEKGEPNWDKLLEPSDVFYKYYDYLAIKLSATEEHMLQWLGYCESKLRKLVELLGETSLFEKIHLHPAEYHNPKILYYEDKDKDINIPLLNSEFFIGLKLKSGEENIDIAIPIEKFYSLYINSFRNKTQDMIIEVEYYESKNLPSFLELDFDKVNIRKSVKKDTSYKSRDSINTIIPYKTRNEIFGKKSDVNQEEIKSDSIKLVESDKENSDSKPVSQTKITPIFKNEIDGENRKDLTASSVKRKSISQMKKKKKDDVWKKMKSG